MSKLARPAFFLAVAVAFVMAILPHPPEIPGAPSDKVQHVMAFATLGILGAVAFPRLSKLRLMVALGVFGAAIELIQAIPVLHRDSDIVDLGADIVALVVAILAVKWIAARFVDSA